MSVVLHSTVQEYRSHYCSMIGPKICELFLRQVGFTLEECLGFGHDLDRCKGDQKQIKNSIMVDEISTSREVKL